MTNAEAAKHFASLPPDGKAEILVLNADTLMADVHSLECTDSDTIEAYEEEEKIEPIPHVTIKW